MEYYHRKTTDMLLWVTTPTSIGYSGYYDNVGDMVNKGIELSLNGDVIRTRNVTWSLDLNLSHNKNEVTYMPAENKTAQSDGYYGYSSSYNFIGEGLPLYTWYIPKYAGVDSQGRSTWYVKNTDGTESTTYDYSKASYYVCDDANPDVYGGFGTSLKVYDFDLSCSFIYSLGGKGLDYGYMSLMGSPTSSSERGNLHKDLYNVWSADNTSSDIPRFQYMDEGSSYVSDRFLTNSSSLTLKNVSLGYTLPKDWIKPLGLTSVRVYCSADNVYYWTKRKGYDPRSAINGLVQASNTFQPIRSISGGITVKF